VSGEDVTPAGHPSPPDRGPIDSEADRAAAPSVEPDLTEPPTEEVEAAPDAVAGDLVCPYLGMVGDRNAHHTFPSRTHLCHAGAPAHVGLGFQLDFCLGGRFPDCARFQRAETAQPQAAQAAPVAAAPVAFASGERLRIPTTRQERGTNSRLVAAMLGLALVGAVLALGVAAGIIALPGSSPAAVVGTPTAPPTGLPSGLPTDSPSPGPADTPTPSTPSTAAPTTSPSASPAASPGPVTHVVQPGETLTSIALLYGVTIDAIIITNGIANPDLIMAGTVLVIPVDASGSPLPVATPTPGPTASDGSTTYVVQPGDTLSDIAIQFGVTVQAIQTANGIENPDELFVGQVLIIPPPP